jgi:hypothetical protein
MKSSKSLCLWGNTRAKKKNNKKLFTWFDALASYQYWCERLFTLGYTDNKLNLIGFDDTFNLSHTGIDLTFKLYVVASLIVCNYTNTILKLGWTTEFLCTLV